MILLHCAFFLWPYHATITNAKEYYVNFYLQNNPGFYQQFMFYAQSQHCIGHPQKGRYILELDAPYFFEAYSFFASYPLLLPKKGRIKIEGPIRLKLNKIAVDANIREG